MSKESLGIYTEREIRLRRMFAPLLVTAAAVVLTGCSGINAKEGIINLPATATPNSAAGTPIPETKPTVAPTPTSRPTPTPGIDINALIKDLTQGNQKLEEENKKLRQEKAAMPTKTRLPISTELMSTPTLYPTPKPTRTPTPPTRTPTPVRPTPTPASTPRPTPEAETIINLLPGNGFSRPYLVTNVSGKPQKRAFKYNVGPGKKEEIRLQIRVPWDEQRIYKEGEEITFPHGANSITATIEARPGANAACSNITLEEYSRDPGSTNLPINTVILPEKVCVPESLKVSFSEHRVNGGNAYSDIVFESTAPAEQDVIYWVPEDTCFKAANRQFLDNNTTTSDNRVTIPAKPSDKESGVAIRTMTTKLASGEKASPPKCEVRFQRILKYQD